jgi:hypothetical protein
MIAYKILRSVPVDERKATVKNFMIARPDMEHAVVRIIDELDAFMDVGADVRSLGNECLAIWPKSWMVVTNRCDKFWMWADFYNVDINAMPKFIECPALGDAEMHVKLELRVVDDRVRVDTMRLTLEEPLYKLGSWWKHRAIATPFHLLIEQNFPRFPYDMAKEESYSALDIRHMGSTTFQLTLKSHVRKIGWYEIQDGERTWTFVYDPNTNTIDWTHMGEDTLTLPPPRSQLTFEGYCGKPTIWWKFDYKDGTHMTGCYGVFYEYQISILLKDIERLIL